MISMIFTTTNKIGSRLIRWGYGGKSSHFAIGFDDKIVFQSHFGGLQLLWFSDFEAKNKIVNKLDYWPGFEIEEMIYDAIKHKKRPVGYDYGALIYQVICVLKTKLFNASRPTRNLWSSKSHAICLEMAEYLEPLVGSIHNLDTMFPDELYSILNERIKDGYIPQY